MSEAQRLADELEVTNGLFMKSEAAALLRRQETLIERQRELLKQALEALERGETKIRFAAITAIRAHREAK